MNIQEKTRLIQAAQAVLHHNWRGSFTRPTEHLYPHQWNWDSGFISLGYIQNEPEKAFQELFSLMKGQWEHGMIPHIVFADDPHESYFPGPEFWECEQCTASPDCSVVSGITQPPVHGGILNLLLELAPDSEEALTAAASLYDSIFRSHQYFYQYRDPNHEGLAYIRHPWESGTDNSNAWDDAIARFDPSVVEMPAYRRKDNIVGKAAHRPTDLDYDYYIYLVDLFRKARYEEEIVDARSPFKIQDPLFNAVLSWSNAGMITVAEKLGKSTAQWKEWLDLTNHGLRSKLWDLERATFNSFDLVAEEVIQLETNSGLIPLLSGCLSEEEAERVHQRILSPKFFGTSDQPAWLCPTLALDHPQLNIEKYWRGPVWINTNWLLYLGCQAYGFSETASRIRMDSLTLLKEFGFQEYFLPWKTLPEGIEPHLGAGKFSWSAALCIHWLTT